MKPQHLPAATRVAVLVVTLLVAGWTYADEPAGAQAATPDAVKTFVYKKTKQGELKIHVHYPPGWKAADKRPGIVFFFGGGWNGGTVKQFEGQAAYLAGRGMVAARADYRVKSRQGVTPDACVEDAKSAVRWLRSKSSELGIDPQRIVGSGGSAGGHLAACTALSPGLEAEGEDHGISSQPNALLLFNPVLDFTLSDSLLNRLGDNKEVARQISPTLHLTKDTPPALILFGTADRLIVHGKKYMEASKKTGNRAEFFEAEGVGHGFFNRPPWYERTLYRADEFLATLGYVKGKPTLKRK